MSTHTWPIRSYPRSCVVEGNQYAGPGAARHYTRFADKNNSNTRYTGDRTWWTYGESIGLEGFEMAAGAELEVIMEMDWTENASKDFSLVLWGTGTQPILITSDFDGVNQSMFPFTNPLSSDQNATEESGADLCAENPAEAAFADWVAGQQGFNGSCGSRTAW
jgi:hypothetical protein